MNKFWVVYMMVEPRGAHVPKRPYSDKAEAIEVASELAKRYPRKTIYILEKIMDVMVSQKVGVFSETVK